MGYQKEEKFRSYADRVVEKCKKIITISKDNDKLVLDTFKDVNGKNIIIKMDMTQKYFIEKNIKKKMC